MCGIAGIISLSFGQIPLSTITKMTNAIAHRGPDGEGEWQNEKGNVLLGHRRLAIIDLSNAAAQPMHYLNRYTITYNGEIYNYIELKKTLSQHGYFFTTKSDTEVILAAYDFWKQDCLQRFDGMFAFSIWDEKEQHLFAARDRFGEKPFYYFNDNDCLFFASEMKALWAIDIPKNVDEKMLLNYLAFGQLQSASDKELTFFKEIYSLPPAHYFLYSPSAKKVIAKKYWHLDTEIKISIPAAEAINTFKELFTSSIQKRLRSDVAVGTSLSGGLDSSSILFCMQKLKNNFNQIKTFSAVFPGFAKDESFYINLITNKTKVQNFTTQPNAIDLIQNFEKLCYYQEEPFQSSSIFAQYKVFELAKQNNVKVLLDGQGADETLAGYNKYIQWYLQELLSRYKYKKMLLQKKAIQKNKIHFNWGAKNFFAAFFPLHTAIQLEKREYKRITSLTDINSEYLQLQQGREWEGILKPAVTKLNDILHFNTIQLGLEELLRYADRNSMAHGIEVRLPFLNHHLVKFIFSLPSNFKINEGYTKWILRKAMEKKLPKEIVWQKDKTGYEPPQQTWMQNTTLQEYLHEAKRKLVTENILNKSVLEKKIIPKTAHDKDNFDWRYLCAAQII